MKIESDSVEDLYASKPFAQTGVEWRRKLFGIGLFYPSNKLSAYGVVLDQEQIERERRGKPFPKMILWVPHHGNLFTDESLSTQSSSDKPSRWRVQHYCANRRDEPAYRELLSLIANQVETSIHALEGEIESRLRRRLREELIPQLRDELLPLLRDEVMRELESGELFEAADQGFDFLEWCSEHAELLEEYSDTNVAIDTDRAEVVLSDPDEWEFITKLKAVEKQSGKVYRVLHTGAYAALINAKNL